MEGRRLVIWARRAGIVICLAALGVGLYLLGGIAVSTDTHTGQERLNGRADNAPLVAPLLLLLGGAGGLVVLLPSRASRQ